MGRETTAEEAARKRLAERWANKDADRQRLVEKIAEGREATRGADVDAMMARGVRVKHLAYADALLDTLRSGVPARTLVEWGIPAADVRDASERLDLPSPPARETT